MSERKFYFQVKNEKDEWVNEKNAYYSCIGGVWSQVIRMKKNYQGKEKRILVKNKSDDSVFSTISLSDSIIEFYEKSRKTNMEKATKEDDSKLYEFEIKIIKKVGKNASVIEWINPISPAQFSSIKSLWEYIVRNDIIYEEFKKRISIKNIKGETINISEINQDLLESMKIYDFGEF